MEHGGVTGLELHALSLLNVSACVSHGQVIERGDQAVLTGVCVLLFSTDAHVLTGDDPVLGSGLPDPPQPGEPAANTGLSSRSSLENEVVLLHTPCGFMMTCMEQVLHVLTVY